MKKILAVFTVLSIVVIAITSFMGSNIIVFSGGMTSTQYITLATDIVNGYGSVEFLGNGQFLYAFWAEGAKGGYIVINIADMSAPVIRTATLTTTLKVVELENALIEKGYMYWNQIPVAIERVLNLSITETVLSIAFGYMPELMIVPIGIIQEFIVVPGYYYDKAPIG